MTLTKPIPELQEKERLRFLSGLSPTDSSFHGTRCWGWNGKVSETGYGRFHFRGKSYPAHRISVRLYLGMDIPCSLTVDHLCRNKWCVNPLHLEVVTHRVNVQRERESRTYCPAGHLRTTENTGESKTATGRNQKYCKPCRRAAYKSWYDKNYKDYYHGKKEKG